MFVGITLLAQAFHVLPSEQETVVSQLARGVFGSRGVPYYAVQAGTMLILVLAANTAYADFPRLASILARDRYLPRQLMNQGDRLAFSNGIVGLSVFAAILLVVFGGDTHALIPLYMIGVFVSFTLSQAGMVMHWRRLRGPGWKTSAAINGVGALVTGIVLVVVAVTKSARRRVDHPAADPGSRHLLPRDHASTTTRCRRSSRLHGWTPRDRRTQRRARADQRHSSRGRRRRSTTRRRCRRMSARSTSSLDPRGDGALEGAMADLGTGRASWSCSTRRIGR